MTNEEIHIERQIRILCAAVAMRVQEEMDSTHEAMVADHKRQRAARCAKQRVW